MSYMSYIYLVFLLSSLYSCVITNGWAVGDHLYNFYHLHYNIFIAIFIIIGIFKVVFSIRSCNYSIFRPFCTNGFQINFTSLQRLVFIYLSFRLFMDGIEEYLIQPTAWYYVKYLGGTNLFLGLTMAAYSVGTLVLAPFVGFVEEKFDASKAIVVFSTFVKFFGNILYSIPFNEYFPLFGRFLSGIGEGAVGVLLGAVAKCTTKENRAKAFLYFEGLFCIGSVCGPAIGSVLTFNTDILGGLHSSIEHAQF